MTGGRAVGKQRRGEYGAEDFETLDLRNQHAEAIARMSHILAAESQHHAGNWRVTDGGERGEIKWVGRARHSVRVAGCNRRSVGQRTAYPTYLNA